MANDMVSFKDCVTGQTVTGEVKSQSKGETVNKVLLKTAEGRWVWVAYLKPTVGW
jgi:hypothetical protein